MDQITTIAVAYATIIAATGCAFVETQYIKPTIEVLRDRGHKPCGGLDLHDLDTPIGTYIYIEK